MEWGSRNTPTDLLAKLLMTVDHLGRPVVNQTGLSGQYDFTLRWTPEPESARPSDATQLPSQTTFMEALHDQLGLKLRAGKAPVEIIVIDHIEPVSDN
jgi:bla regulator protein blaR1